MLIFNCSTTACERFSRIRHGQHESLITPARASNLSDDTQYLDLPGEYVSQWYAHSVKYNQRHLMVVMHAQSYYSMLFLGLKKGDANAFQQVFMKRWLNNIHMQCQRLNMHEPNMLTAVNQSLPALHQQVDFHHRIDKQHLFMMEHIADLCITSLQNLRDLTAQDLPTIEIAINDQPVHQINRHTEHPAQAMINQLFGDVLQLTDSFIHTYNQRYRDMQKQVARRNLKSISSLNRNNVVKLEDYRDKKMG